MIGREFISFARLLDWLEGRLSPAEAAEVAAWVQEEADTAVQADLQWLQHFQQLSQQLHLETPPNRVRQTLRQQFMAYKRQTQKPPSFFDKLIATLTYDSLTQPAAIGLRTDTSSTSRQFVYTTQVGEIVLNLQPHLHMPQLDLLGQIFLHEEFVTPLSVQLLQAQIELGLTTPNDLGEFAFTQLPQGEATLVVSSDQFEITLHSIPLQA